MFFSTSSLPNTPPPPDIHSRCFFVDLQHTYKIKLHKKNTFSFRLSTTRFPFPLVCPKPSKQNVSCARPPYGKTTSMLSIQPLGRIGHASLCCMGMEAETNPGVGWVLKRGILILFQVGGFRMAGSVFSGWWPFFTCFTYVYMIIFTATWCFCLGLPKISAWSCYMYIFQRLVLRSCYIYIFYIVSQYALSGVALLNVHLHFGGWISLNFWSESWWLIGQLLRCNCPTKPPSFNPVRTVVLPFRSHFPNNGTAVCT